MNLPKLDFLSKKPKVTKEQKLETARQQALVRETIYPILLKHAKNIKDAKNICKNFVVALDAAFYLDAKAYQERRSVESLGTLDLKKAINEDKQNSAEFELLEILNNEEISTVKSLIGGMEQELNRLTDKELVERPLESLKTEFI